MKAILNGVLDELKALRKEGVQELPLGAETMRALRTTLAERKEGALCDVVEPENAEPLLNAAPKVKPEAEAKPEAKKLPPPPDVELPEGDKATQYAWLRDKILNCEVCKAHVKPGKKIVMGSGHLDAKIFYCGEAPGAEEETEGEVFVGPAGQLLMKVIQAMGLKREAVYIANIMNWRPDVEVGNRPPTREEMQFCLPYLRAQLAIVKPEVIVALGKTAVDGLLGPDPKRRMGKARGQWYAFDGRPLMVAYHPSYILRNDTLKTKRQIWEDMLLVMERVGMPISEKQKGYFLK